MGEWRNPMIQAPPHTTPINLCRAICQLMDYFTQRLIKLVVLVHGYSRGDPSGWWVMLMLHHIAQVRSWRMT
jgi:hypothetical protein